MRFSISSPPAETFLGSEIPLPVNIVRHEVSTVLSSRPFVPADPTNFPPSTVFSHTTRPFIHIPIRCSLVRFFPSPFLEEHWEEVMRMVHEIVSMKTLIIEVNKERNTLLSKRVGMSIETKINLEDVFRDVEMNRYPLLWNEAIKINTIVPTTVSCERCFSVIKQSFHTNMKSDTLIANVMNKLHEGPKKKPLHRCFQNIWPDFSKYLARRVPLQNRLHDVWGRQEGVNDDNVDITTEVTTRFPRGVDGDQAGYDGVRPATQVGRRRVEGCLRGHDDGVSRVDEGVENASIRLRKPGRLQCRNRPPPRFHVLFKIKGSYSPGNSNIMTVAFVRGVFCIPRRRKRHVPMTASPRLHDSTF